MLIFTGQLRIFKSTTLRETVLFLVFLALFPFSAFGQTAVIERYHQALDVSLQEVQREIAALDAILERATRHQGFVTGDLWNIPAGLYTEEYYWVLTNRYPFAPFWERAVSTRMSSSNFAAHQANYSRVISGVELLPGHGALRLNLSQAHRFSGLAGSHQDPMISASLPEGLLNHMQRQLQRQLQAAGLGRLGFAEQAALAQALENDSGLQRLLDKLLQQIYLDGLDRLYSNRVSFGNLPRAEGQQAGIIACLKAPDDAYQPALHRDLLAACNGKHLLPSLHAAYQLENDNNRATALELFRGQALNIRFDLSYEPFVVSGSADERARFSQLYDLEQLLQAQVTAGRAREERHGSMRFFIDTQFGEGYPGVIAVDFTSGAGLWMTPLFMARDDIQQQTERVNTAIQSAFAVSRDTFDVLLDEFLYRYGGATADGAAQTDGF